MFDRPQSTGDRAILVFVDFDDPKQNYSDQMEEFVQLVTSAGIECVSVVSCKRDRPDAALFVGSGKADEIGELLKLHAVQLVIFNHGLSSVQERNLEARLQARVIDRTTLILDIFAQRARSNEGKLQVELAQLKHLSTRLIRGWTHLERQGGGVGLRGPGETQLETDRRLLGDRVKLLEGRLAQAVKQRDVRRRARERSRVFSVALVGYTNAGKSTLFNRLTREKVYVQDQLFATLDTTSRRLYMGAMFADPAMQAALTDSTSEEDADAMLAHYQSSFEQSGELVISDTVGFIQNLPHALVASFSATLEETVQADLLLHVVDASHPMRDMQITAVNKVLKEIGADSIPQIVVLNKIDKCSDDAVHLMLNIMPDVVNPLPSLALSAMTGEGFAILRETLSTHLAVYQQRKDDGVRHADIPYAPENH